MAVRANVQIQLGLINFPVSVETAVQDETEAKFNTVCVNSHPPAKIRQTRACPECQATEGFTRAKDNGDGTFTVVTDEIVAKVQASDAEKKTMPITAHPAAEVAGSTLPGGKVYFLVDKNGNEAYPLVTELLKRHPETALCTMWAPRSKTAMFRLGVFGDTLTLTELAWPERVSKVNGTTAVVNEAMIPMGEQFLEMLTAEFDPASFTSTRSAVLAEFLESATAVQGVAPVDTPTGTAPAAPVDLMAALTAATKQPAKKRAAKKATTKKAAKRKAS